MELTSKSHVGPERGSEVAQRSMGGRTIRVSRFLRPQKFHEKILRIHMLLRVYLFIITYITINLRNRVIGIEKCCVLSNKKRPLLFANGKTL